MKNFCFFLIILTVISGCYSAETTNIYDHGLTNANSSSAPIYLTIPNNKESTFHFLLNRDTSTNDYKLHVKWTSKNKGKTLFNGMETTLKFLVDHSKILTFKPIKRPRIVAYDLNEKGNQEEAIFSLTPDEFHKIAYAKSVDVELNGKFHSVIGYFNLRNTMKAFREFAENCH